jgi:hypothetical protein
MFCEAMAGKRAFSHQSGLEESLTNNEKGRKG